MATEKFTEDELAMLTDEERAGLEEDIDVEDEDDGDEDDGTEAKAGDDDAGKKDAAVEQDEGEGDKSAAGDDGDEAKGASEKKPDADAAKIADAEADAGAGEGDKDADSPAPASDKSVLPNWTAPADADETLAAIDKKKDDLAAKFDDGELTAKEFREQMKPLEEQQAAINRKVLKAEMSWEAAVNTWAKQTVPSFLQDHPEYEPGTLRYRLLDAEVRDMQKESDNKFDPAILAKAHEKIAAELGGATAKKTTTKDDPAKKREIPPSLSGLPAADITETNDGGEYAYLDRLAEKDGVAFEAALAKLTDTQREQYLAS